MAAMVKLQQSHTVGPIKETAIVGAGQAMHVSARLSDVIVAVRATCTRAASHAMLTLRRSGSCMVAQSLACEACRHVASKVRT